MFAPTKHVLHNGPVCMTCGARYIGHHECSAADIQRRINELLSLLPGTRDDSCRPSPTRDCRCHPENGGSGVCGCVLGGPKVTC
jgi:hypothetical protein